MPGRIVGRVVWMLGLAGIGMAVSAGPTPGADCPAAAPTFAYGNAGFNAGYGGWVHGLAVPSNSCAVSRTPCGPCWRPCLPRPCPPLPCGWRAGPSCDWGAAGIARYACRESVFLSVSPGGSATFFSGSCVPCPWYPSGGYSPGWYPYGWTPAGSVLPGLPGPPRLSLVDRGPPVRMSNADARRRAQRLIDAGDRHLRHALVERPKLATALSSYRRAAAIAPDLPDPLIRQAIVLVALDRQADASQALATVTAIDPRLGDSVGARGAAVVHEICQGTPSEEGPGLNWIAERWSERWHPEMARLAGGAAAAGR